MLDKEYIEIIQRYENKIKNDDFSFLNDMHITQAVEIIKFLIFDCDIDLKKYSNNLHKGPISLIDSYSSYITKNSDYIFYDKNKNPIMDDDVKVLHDEAFYISVNGNKIEPLNGKVYHLSDKYGCLIYDENLYKDMTWDEAMKLGKNGFHLASILENDLLMESRFVDWYYKEFTGSIWSSIEKSNYNAYGWHCDDWYWYYYDKGFADCCVLVKSF